jgi:hypothetical protein
MEQTTNAVINGKNDAVGVVKTTTNIIKGVDGLLVADAKSLITKNERVVLKRFFNDFCKLKNDGTIHAVINNDYLSFFVGMVEHLTIIDIEPIKNDSKNLLSKVLTACVNSCLKFQCKAFDKSSDLNSWRVLLNGVGVLAFVKQFILSYLHLTNKMIIEYNQTFKIIDAETLKQIKINANFELWQKIRHELGLATDNDNNK